MNAKDKAELIERAEWLEEAAALAATREQAERQFREAARCRAMAR